ncbi:50S ribosomal protein L4 [Candidatus Gugararchaeum adminiculabundum]|nr:50S ribosomal protein L4 [Candidatus Gugararchaeum adminiculabundum]
MFMKADVLSIEGKVLKQVELPAQFGNFVRVELIRRAVLSEQSERYQPKGPYKYAGLETSAKYRGRKEAYASNKNKGESMLPHEVLPKGRYGKVKRIPSAVKGRRAHPPKPEHIIVERINAKEHEKAIASAIAATASAQYVKARGHVFDAKIKLPLILETKVEEIAKAKDFASLIEKLGIASDVERAKDRAKKRSGVRKRKAGRVMPRSILVVAGDANAAILKAARNIAGVDVASIDELDAEMLAPGSNPGRLTLWTESAIEKLRGA